MRIRIAATAAFAALALGAAACTEAEQDTAQTETNEAAADTGSAIEEEAAQVGSAIAAGAGEVAQEIDEGTDRLAEEADEQKAETQRDTKGN